MKTIGFMIACSLCLLGCGQSTDSNDKTAENKAVSTVSQEQVTLKIFTNVPLTDTEFQNYLVDPVKNKYPYITLQQTTSADQKLENLISAQDIPDIIYAGPDLHANIMETDIPLDLSELLKQHNVSLSRFQPAIIQGIKQFGPNGQIYALPFARNTVLLWYNKNIFDQFGVAYPTDGMTWDQTLDLARRLTRSEGGKQYRGLEPHLNGIQYLASPLSLPLVDPTTEKAIISDPWKNVFKLAMDFYNIPGNRPDKLINATQYFIKDQNVAMFPHWLNRVITDLEAQGDNGLNWDVVQYPSFPEAPNMGSQVDWHQFVISKTSKYKEQAFQVINLATSDEVQKIASKKGRITVVDNQDIYKQFASELPLAKGKNMQSVFKGIPAERALMHEYYPLVSKQIEAAFQNVFDGKTDINTALREATDKANADIAAAKVK
jgi:multiple sugar transport system substrate-binding protein